MNFIVFAQMTAPLNLLDNNTFIFVNVRLLSCLTLVPKVQKGISTKGDALTLEIALLASNTCAIVDKCDVRAMMWTNFELAFETVAT